MSGNTHHQARSLAPTTYTLHGEIIVVVALRIRIVLILVTRQKDNHSPDQDRED